jgi:Uma2 family endonuclease
MTLEEFLALPEVKPYREFVNGVVVEKSLPNEPHGLIVVELAADLRNYLKGSGEGVVASEVRHSFESETEQRVYLPDLHVTLHSSRRGHEGENPVRVQPDFAIEVLSPDDRAGSVLERVEFYIRAGTRLLWIVDPELESITVYRPGEGPQIARAGSELDARPVLRDFRLNVADLFSVLH